MLPLFQRLVDVTRDLRHRTAIVDAGAQLTYAQLIDLAAAFGEELLAAGIRRGDRVGVLLGNQAEFLIAAFGIWKQGAILTPLHPQLTERELSRYVFDSALRALVGAARSTPMIQTLLSAGAPLEHAWLCHSDGERWRYLGAGNVAPRRGQNLSEPTEDQDPGAVTQYSTGSTGYPKRVTRTHLQLLGEFQSVSGVLGTSPADTILGVAPFSHSHGLMNAAVLTLLSGGTLHVSDCFFPRDVAALIERERVTGLPAVPFMFQLLADLPERYDLSCLRFAVSAGAPLSAETAEAFYQRYGVRIRQLYGSTETGVIALRGEDAAADRSSVGHAIPGVSVRILAEDGAELPAEMQGRVSVSSPYAAKHYDVAVHTSDSSFGEDEFFPGDLGRLRADGELVLCGRERGFINVGGSKVDPGEVEAALLECSGVTEAVVVGVADGAAGEKIKAVLVTSSEASRDLIRAHCMQRLAPFKQPKIIEFREQLPRSPLGKILRKYLLEDVDESPDRYVFDPFTGFGRVSEHAKVSASSCDFAAVPALLRALLSTDGTVTRLMEAFFWEPIEVNVLSHAYVACGRDYPALGIVAGDIVLRRRVTLRGKRTRSVYAFADSVMGRDCVAADLRRRLIDESKGIGELLRQERIETYRELLTVRRAAAGEWAMYLELAEQASVLVRSYTIQHSGRATIEIEEVFPEARFQRAP